METGTQALIIGRHQRLFWNHDKYFDLIRKSGKDSPAAS